MKLIISLAFVLFGHGLFAQADNIVGLWFNQEQTAKVEISKAGSQYNGKIVWLKEPNDPATNKPKVDKANPETNLKSRPLIGLIMLSGFSWNADDKAWEGGTMYDPKKGKTYSCVIKQVNAKTLDVRGYIGGLGRTTTWTRAN